MGERKSKGCVYFLRCPSNGYIKIGRTDREVSSRFTQLRAVSPVPIEIMATMEGTERLERKLHVRFSRHWSHGEWFRPDPKLLEFIEHEAKPWEGTVYRTRHIVSRVITENGGIRPPTVYEWADATKVTFCGRTQTVTEWAQMANLTVDAIKRRIGKGVIVENLFLRFTCLENEPAMPESYWLERFAPSLAKSHARRVADLHAQLDAKIAAVKAARRNAP